MQPELQDMVRRIQSLSRLRHGEFRRRADDTPRAEPEDVGRVAAKLARKYYEPEYNGSQHAKALVCQCAGNLIYAMDCWGLGFEGVCDASELRVAQVVSGLSPDITLPHGLRKMGVVSKLAEASVDSQLVRLAELLCTARKVRATFEPEDLRVHAEALRRWADDAEACFEALNKLRLPRARALRPVLDETLALILWVGKAGDPPRPSRAAAPAGEDADAVAVAVAVGDDEGPPPAYGPVESIGTVPAGVAAPGR